MMPNKWRSNKLRDLGELKYGKSPKEVITSESGFPVVGTSGVVGFAEKPLFKGPLIMVGRKGTIDKPMLVDGDCWIIDTAYGLFPNNEVADLKWLLYFLQNYGLGQLNEATGVPSLSRDNLYNIDVPTPPLLEQRKIADILTSIDDAIEKTEAIIKQTDVVKKGLMQHLLTRGIGHTKFKKTEIGTIPVAWQVKRVRDIANVEYGISESVSANTDPRIGIPILTGANITLDGRIDLSKMVYVQKRSNERFELKKGDLLFNWRSGSSQHVGKTAIFDLDGDYTYASFVLRIRMSEGNCNVFYYHLLNYLRGAGYFAKDTSMQVNFKLNAATFRELILPCPSLEEQRKIAEILTSVDAKVGVERRRMVELETLKTSLMQLLLTGKIRVKVDEQVEAVVS